MIRVSAVALIGAWAPLASLPAQLTARLSGQGILIYTHADPVPGGGSLGEARLVQPILMLDLGALRQRLLFHVTADFEGWTIPNGELAPGDWGEGFVDRRHPHTYLHELILSTPDVLHRWDLPVQLSLSAGKGFVPFGSDDPMSRPVERFPVNHHWCQVLERAVGMAALQAGRVTVEAALFNGDEPERPSQAPNLSRFGDSWAGRVTLRPLIGLEWQTSAATVHSPESRGGAGTDTHLLSTSLRVERRAGRTHLYGFVEWGRASEANGTFVFHTVLAEAAVAAGRHRPYYRVERTERPEDARTLDPFRTVRPHLDNSILGIDRWSIHTAGYGVRFGAAADRLELQPFVEISYGRIAQVGAGLFDPTAVYGRATLWTASVGLRVGWGMDGHRMGRYGVPMEPMNMPGMSLSDRAP